jgi:hypothetical protein
MRSAVSISNFLAVGVLDEIGGSGSLLNAKVHP